MQKPDPIFTPDELRDAAEAVDNLIGYASQLGVDAAHARIPLDKLIHKIQSSGLVRRDVFTL